MTETLPLFTCRCGNPLPNVSKEDQNYVYEGEPLCSFFCLIGAETTPTQTSATTVAVQ